MAIILPFVDDSGLSPGNSILRPRLDHTNALGLDITITPQTNSPSPVGKDYLY